MMIFLSRHLFAVLSRPASFTVKFINALFLRVQKPIWFPRLSGQNNLEARSTGQSSPFLHPTNTPRLMLSDRQRRQRANATRHLRFNNSDDDGAGLLLGRSPKREQRRENDESDERARGAAWSLKTRSLGVGREVSGLAYYCFETAFSSSSNIWMPVSAWSVVVINGGARRILDGPAPKIRSPFLNVLRMRSSLSLVAYSFVSLSFTSSMPTIMPFPLTSPTRLHSLMIS